jgi:glutamate carboxypeptidase
LKSLDIFSQRIAIESYVQRRMDHYLDILEQMVGINSFTWNPKGIDKLGAITAELFRGLGFVDEKVTSVNANFGAHRVLFRKGSSKSQIGLVSHLDTVYAAEEEMRHNFVWRREGERIYGPGVLDIKGGTVMIYAILETLRQITPELFEELTWIILLDASEEDDARDFGQLCIERLSSDTLGCLVFESGDWSDSEFALVVARKGRAVFRIEVEGRASHAGAAHGEGANAIAQLSEVIQKIEQLTDYKQQLTVNVGYVEGGGAINRVPHRALALVEMRAFGVEVYRKALEAILSFDGYSSISSAINGYRCRVKVTLERETPPWPRNDATEQLCDIWADIAHPLGYSVVRQERGGLSDGNLFWQCTPVLDGLGPAGANAHCSEQSTDGSKQQEFMLLPSFIPKTILNCLAILKLCETR